MDDSCAVCADPLEWVAYGPCGHRDVCSTCVVRLRFICDDRRCCICKSESSVIFVTKALGDYTRMISDFSLLPVEPREGRVGSYWYHEDTQAFFDDVDHYKMIKAMCRLSCSVCDKDEEEGGPPHTGGVGPKRRPARFKNVEHLKGHLFHKHKLIMCSLCLEGRKVFICEQKLYTRAQLNQHISTGDSEVDGSESERGGFAGHPMCEFCKSPFYGDNELYSHMSTEHYTCHICQRQHPGQYEYYKNYDDLEMHFRRDHFLCEDEGCLAKKFVVFQSEGEMKRHDTLEHGGRMSRSQRNAALQIPTSFRYRRGAEQEQRRGRVRIFRRDESDNQLYMAIEASLGTAESEALSRDHSSASSRGVVSDPRNMDDIHPLIQPFESLTATGTDLLRYRQALGHSSGIRPDESAFPPLSIASSSGQQNSMNLRNEGLLNNTMATQLRQKNNRKANARENSAQAWPAAIQGRVSNSARQVIGTNSSSTSRSSTSGPASSGYPSLPQARTQVQAMPSTNNGQPSSALTSNMMNSGRISHSASAPNSTRQVIGSNSSSTSLSSTTGSASFGYPSLPQSRTQVQAMPSTNNGQPSSALTSNMMNSGRISHSASAPNSTRQVIGSNSSSASQNSTSGPASSGYPSLPQARTLVQARPNTNNGQPSSALSLTSNVVNSGRISHSASAPNLAGSGSSQRPISDFPPITAAVRKLPADKQVLLAVADVQSANKSLVEKLRSALEYDDDRYTSFKEISGQYRQGLLGTSKYLDYVQQYGLQDLVFDLAMLCPDPLKQKELVDTYNARVRSNGKQENGSKKGKAPTVEAGSSRDRLADNVINTVRSLQSQFKPQEEEVEELSRDGYRAAKGKSNLIPDGPQVESRGQTGSTSSSVGSILNGKDGTGGGKMKKKTSKFNRVRLGDGSIAALLDGGSSAPEPGPNPLDEKPGDSLPVRGVWRKGGVQKLFL